MSNADVMRAWCEQNPEEPISQECKSNPIDDGDHFDLIDALYSIPFDGMDHYLWMKIGTALKNSGVPFEVFDEWSATDTRTIESGENAGRPQYQGTVCTWRQWESFNDPTFQSGYVVRVAESHGWVNPRAFNGRMDDYNGEYEPVNEYYDDPVPLEAYGFHENEKDDSTFVDVTLENPLDPILDNPFLVYNEKGNIEKPEADAIYFIIEHDPNINGLRLETMSQDIVCGGEIPWWKRGQLTWTKADWDQILLYLQRNYRTSRGAIIKDKSDIKTALSGYVNDHAFDALEDMLDSLPAWDGVQRAETFFIDFMGVDDTEYTRAATRIWMLGAVKRAYVPGCDFRYVIVMDGKQGIGKSRSLKVLAMRKKFYCEDLKGIGTKTAQESVQGRWIVELGELDAINTATIAATKLFLSQEEDKYRVPYDPKNSDHPRRCVFAGTSNPSEYLIDDENTRYLPFTCHNETTDPRLIDDNFIIPYVEQIWAEVLTWYRNDPNVRLELPSEVMSEVEMKRKKASISDPWEDPIYEYLYKLEQGWETSHKQAVTCNQAIARDVLDIKLSGLGRRDKRYSRIKQIVLSREGWKEAESPKYVPGFSARQRAYEYVGVG